MHVYQAKSLQEKEVQKHYLYPGALFASKTPTIVTTVLGTCVSVCLFDPTTKVGGINHFMLPLWNGDGLPSPKYGNIAIEKLIEKMIGMGCQKSNLQAKLFGGKSEGYGAISQYRIGEKNAEIARSFLIEEGIPVVASNLKGGAARRLLFHTHTGEVLMYYLVNPEDRR